MITPRRSDVLAGRLISPALLFHQRCESLRCCQAVAALYHHGYFVPIDTSIKPHANPSFVADVRWYEEALGIRPDQMGLVSWQGFAPEGRPAVAVITDVQGENSLAHAKCGLFPRLAFDRLGQSKANCSQPFKMSLCHPVRSNYCGVGDFSAGSRSRPQHNLA
jgi:hypothetical protein